MACFNYCNKHGQYIAAHGSDPCPQCTPVKGVDVSLPNSFAEKTGVELCSAVVGALPTCPFCGHLPELIVTNHEDDNRYPRLHWHAKVECEWCGANQGEEVVSEQEAAVPDPARVQLVIDKWSKRAG